MSLFREAAILEMVHNKAFKPISLSEKYALDVRVEQLFPLLHNKKFLRLLLESLERIN
jgi:hypothetical protein